MVAWFLGHRGGACGRQPMCGRVGRLAVGVRDSQVAYLKGVFTLASVRLSLQRGRPEGINFLIFGGGAVAWFEMMTNGRDLPW